MESSIWAWNQINLNVLYAEDIVNKLTISEYTKLVANVKAGLEANKKKDNRPIVKLYCISF